MSQLQANLPLPSGVEQFQELLHKDGAQLRQLRATQCARRRRSKYFASELFSDPAWDMLLELYAAELEQRRISTTGLSYAAGVPLTTGLRWIDVFIREGLIAKRCDPLDGRRVYIGLSANGVAAMSAYFASEGKNVPAVR
jgi:DNA-binding MarR family transcriptional regulator